MSFSLTTRPVAACRIRNPAICAALIAIAVPAYAVKGDTFSPYVGVTRTYDNNLLRLPNRATALAVTGSEKTSDTITVANAGIKFDKQYMRQMFNADVFIAKNSYDRYQELDNISRGYVANWGWHAFDDLDGNFISSYSHALAPIEDFRQAANVKRTQHFNLLEARYLVTPSWRVRSDVSRYALSYELDTLKPFELTLNRLVVGIDFLPATGSTFGLQVGRTSGGYPGAQAGVVVQNGDYTLDEFKGLAKWKFTPQTSFQFLGGWVQRKEDNAAAKDFNGINARLTGDWAPTAKLSFAATAFREFAATGDLVSNYTLNRGLDLSSKWDVSYKIRVEASARSESRDYNGITTLINTTAQNRDDRLRTFRLASTYQPTSHIKITAGLFKNIVDSNIAQLAYRSNGAALNAQYEF
ncbi:MAG: XrtB/PEP-CTERM-associated polysaccharide biosynthesis outer membrane protein EpsL [Pseudomonadota bacterium]